MQRLSLRVIAGEETDTPMRGVWRSSTLMFEKLYVTKKAP